MEQLLNFFIDIGKLEGKKRKGWAVLNQIEDSESTAEHIFRCAVLAWVLGRGKELNIGKVIKMVLTHGLCEIYGKDETPFDDLLSKDAGKKEIEEIMRRRPRAQSSLEQRKTTAAKKSKMEREAIEDLILNLPDKLKRQIRNLCLEYEKGFSEEARFARQANKMENVIQALEYWKEQGKIKKDFWINSAREVFTDPIFIEFLEVLDRAFSPESSGNIKHDKEYCLVNFFIDVGKLKKLPKRGWVLIGIKNPQSVSEHSFRVALMAWVLGEQKDVNLDIERVIKMALIHDLCEAYAGDKTPYDVDSLLPEEKEKWPQLFNKWPRFSKSEKTRHFQKKHEAEQASLMRIISRLPASIKNEILNLWLDYERGLTREGRFCKQVNRVETLLRALEYGWERDERPFDSWWIGTREKVDDPLLLGFMEELDRKFCFKSLSGDLKKEKFCV